jgi:hypothetical protein
VNETSPPSIGRLSCAGSISVGTELGTGWLGVGGSRSCSLFGPHDWPPARRLDYDVEERFVSGALCTSLAGLTFAILRPLSAHGSTFSLLVSAEVTLIEVPLSGRCICREGGRRRHAGGWHTIEEVHRRCLGQRTPTSARSLSSDRNADNMIGSSMV